MCEMENFKISIDRSRTAVLTVLTTSHGRGRVRALLRSSPGLETPVKAAAFVHTINSQFDY
jgi:hypothetical protein